MSTLRITQWQPQEAAPWLFLPDSMQYKYWLCSWNDCFCLVSDCISYYACLTERYSLGVCGPRWISRMTQGAGKKTIGQNSPEALPEAFKRVCKLVPNSIGKVALSNACPLPCQFCWSVHHLNDDMIHKIKVKSTDREKQNPKWECGVAATLKVRAGLEGCLQNKRRH